MSTNNPLRYPSSIRTPTEKVFWDRLERDGQVIRAMQRRIARNPVLDILWRKPWRAPHRPHGLRDLLQWLRLAHDCQNPAVGCSCHPSFRFPASATPKSPAGSPSARRCDLWASIPITPPTRPTPPDTPAASAGGPAEEPLGPPLPGEGRHGEPDVPEPATRAALTKLHTVFSIWHCQPGHPPAGVRTAHRHRGGFLAGSDQGASECPS
jgi:hypothetical protein